MSQLLSLCSRPREPQGLSPRAITTEARTPKTLCSATREAAAMKPSSLKPERGPCSLQLEKSLEKGGRASAAKDTFNKGFKKRLLRISRKVVDTDAVVTPVALQIYQRLQFHSALQFSSVAQSRSTLCDPVNRSTPGLPVHHQLLEFTQTHVHQVSDATQPSHPRLSPSPPAPNPSQHQSLFQ